jgi:hypothetical protein
LLHTQTEAVINLRHEVQSEAVAISKSYPLDLDATGGDEDRIRYGHRPLTGPLMITNDNFGFFFERGWTVPQSPVLRGGMLTNVDIEHFFEGRWTRVPGACRSHREQRP